MANARIALASCCGATVIRRSFYRQKTGRVVTGTRRRFFVVPARFRQPARFARKACAQRLKCYPVLKSEEIGTSSMNERIGNALARIEAVLDRPNTKGPDSLGFSELAARHKALRDETKAVLSALDAAIADAGGRR
jgi:hypothetical protein